VGSPGEQGGLLLSPEDGFSWNEIGAVEFLKCTALGSVNRHCFSVGAVCLKPFSDRVMVGAVLSRESIAPEWAPTAILGAREASLCYLNV